MSFINAVLGLEGSQEIRDISFIDRELDPDIDNGKQSRLDVYGLADDGSKINIDITP